MMQSECRYALLLLVRLIVLNRLHVLAEGHASFFLIVGECRRDGCNLLVRRQFSTSGSYCDLDSG